MKEFLKNKLAIMSKDKQQGFGELCDPLAEMAEKGESTRAVKIPNDGNWFNVSFDAVELKNDRLVISAKRIKDGIIISPYDPAPGQYVVEFQGTRAAYLRGYYKAHHSIGGWPYIYWNIRSYITHPAAPSSRIYVRDFWANEEIKKLIRAMEEFHGTSNIVNSYINDNLLRFQAGINANRSPQQIEKDWSRGMMENLGYQHVEAFDTGYPRGQWKDVEVHWCKLQQDLRSGRK